MSLIGEQLSAFLPPVPADLNQLGLPSGLVTDLILRRLSLEGTSELEHLGSILKLPNRVVTLFLPICASSSSAKSKAWWVTTTASACR